MCTCDSAAHALRTTKGTQLGLCHSPVSFRASCLFKGVVSFAAREREREREREGVASFAASVCVVYWYSLSN